MKQFFHGNRKRRSYFEGWYFKHQCAQDTMTFIPGITVDPKGQASAYIQFNQKDRSHFFRFPIDLFHAKEEELDVQIGPNRFTAQGVTLDISAAHTRIRGSIQYGPFTPLPAHLGETYSHIFMESNHKIISICHPINGWLEIDGKRNTFRDDLGYIENDWGKSFPQHYLWTHASRKSAQGCTAFRIGIGDTSMIFKRSVAMLCLIYHNGIYYKLTAQNGAKIVDWNENNIEITQNDLRLLVEIEPTNAQNLFVPKDGNMIRIIKEVPSCDAVYRLYKKNELLVELQTEQASYKFAR